MTGMLAGRLAAGSGIWRALAYCAAMSEDSYEDLTACALSEDQEAALLQHVKEGVFMWTNSQGEAFGVVMSFLPKEGKFWMTCAEARKRVPALRRFPRASLCVNSTGSAVGRSKTVTYKGTCVIHKDPAIKEWFYPEFARHLRGDNDTAKVFQQFLDSPHRVIIEFTPDYKLSFDGEVMMQRSPGAARAD
jgi:general stress protein 26